MIYENPAYSHEAQISLVHIESFNLATPSVGQMEPTEPHLQVRLAIYLLALQVFLDLLARVGRHSRYFITSESPYLCIDEGMMPMLIGSVSDFSEQSHLR